jgi:RES domain-containing protein
MRQAWRIVKARHEGTAFDGEGARIYGGRWNSPGTRLVYASATLSLAALESLVHLNPPVAFKWVAIPVSFEERLVEVMSLAGLPADWTEEPPPPSTMEVGDQWVKQARSAVLEIPSVIVRSESNFLLNPAHPDFKKVVIGKSAPFAFDPRLL